MQQTETKETIGNKENAKMLFLELLFLYCFSLRQNTRIYTDIQMVMK